MDLPGELSSGGSCFSRMALKSGRCCKDRFCQNEFQLGTNGGKSIGLAWDWQAFLSFVRRAEHYVHFAGRCEAPLLDANRCDGAVSRLALGRLYTLGATCVTTL